MTHGPPTRGHDRVQASAVGESREREGSRETAEDSSLHGEDGMQFAFGKDMSAMADEMHTFYEEEDLYTFEMGSTPSLDQESYSGIPGEDDLVLVTKGDLEKRLAAAAQNNQAYVSPQEPLGGGRGAKAPNTSDSAAQYEDRRGTSEMGTQSSGVGRTKTAHSIGVGGSVDSSEAGVQSSLQALMHSIGTQGNAGYSDSFEQNVLSMLQLMNDKMASMKSNPTVTQNEIKQQELMQQQLIQSTIGMSLNDPEVMKNLLAMLKGDSKSTSSSRRSSTAFDDLQAKLLLAQEQQRQETRKQFETQAEFREYMRKQMEEQSKLQMMGIQSNFEMYSKKMQEQFAEQQKRLDEELRRRREEEGKSEKRRKRSKDQRNKKKQRKVRSSDSSLSDSDEGMVLQATRPNRPKAPAIKTMQARILTQNLLDDDDMKTESQVSIAKIKEKQEARGKLTRMDTTMRFDNASEALRRYESKNAPSFEEKDEGSSDYDPDDEEMIPVKTVRPVTLKRAEIKTQNGSGFTPARPAPPPPEGKVGRIRRIESGSEADQPLDVHRTEGADNELQAALKKRWKK